MRKLVERPLGQLELIADYTNYTGYLEEDSESLSDVSFYEYEDDGSENERDSERKGGNAESFRKERLGKSLKQTLESKKSKNQKVVSKKANKGKENEKKLLKRIEKGRKIIDESSFQSESETDIKSEQETSPNLGEAHSIWRKKKKLFKRPKAHFLEEGDHRHDKSTSLDDKVVDGKKLRKAKYVENVQKKRGSDPVKVEFASEIRSEKLRNAKLEEESSPGSSDLREVDAETEGITVKAFQRRKKLCKAAELTSAGDKGHKVKSKISSVEMKGKTGEKFGTKEKDYSYVEGVQRKNHISTPHESRVTASPNQRVKQGLSKDQKLIKDEDGLLRAELSGEGRSRLLLKKNFSDKGYSVKSSKHRDLKHEDVAGSSTSGKRPDFNKNVMPSVHDSGKKAGQAVKDMCASLETVHSVVEHQRRAIEKVCDNGVVGEEVSSGVTEGAEGMKEAVPDEKGSGNCITEPARVEVGWVMCDRCCKWRCIPASLADMIESDCVWLCKDNPNKNFADCSVPQEKSNSEINKELEISEISEGDEKHPAIDSKFMNDVEHQSKLSGHPPSTWTLIKHNIFQHRQRKTQTIDEQMECMCKPPEDGGPGCGEDCLNRMLNLECVAQTCPCGDLCSNQQFQRRLYTEVGWFRCGKKGFGLQVLEDVSKGAFIIEYVGEVLDMVAYEARQKAYALGGQKHFYFMTLNSTEVIDACFKGNLGRFINHSCEPNCRTEKWMVNGEVCIGLFAIRDLKKGEEITFNYNFVRVCGAAAKKCLCGSRECRGFIGGDPMTPRSVVHSDSDEDDPEPIMLEESSEEESRIEDSKLLVDKKPHDKLEIIPSVEVQNKERNWALTENTDMQVATPKKVKVKSSIKKPTATSGKGLIIETDVDSDVGVEEKLNKLVDENGGLCKGQSQPDEIATCYLKLLLYHLLNGDGSRSLRELSMVLDALLKTQSRAILVEINSKNGFQLLHKMVIKRSRKDYKQIPIVRKLLKVLEFLAVKRVLTMEQINAEPTRPGAESLKDTIDQLCRHADMEIQQMAHQFRGKWLKGDSQKPLKRGTPDLSKWRLFPKQNQQETSGAAALEDEATRKRKRPSRWDQPSQEVLDTTLAGGLPQSFWPFNANNLLLSNSQQSSLSDHSLRHNEGAVSDELGAKHPCPPSFPAADHHVDAAAPLGTGVVSGIPVEHFTTGSSVGYMSQQGPICIGIPISQFHGTPASAPAPAPAPVPPPAPASAPPASGSDSSYMPHMFSSTHNVNPPSDGQAMPFSSDAMDTQERYQPDAEMQPPDKAEKEPYITFGISHSQFFQQMHGMFGSAFHPWQLQCLMARHAWGPFLAGDARIRDMSFMNDSGPVSRQPEYRGFDESGGKPVEPNIAGGAVGYAADAEPPVPGLSPPLSTPPPPPPFSYAPLPPSQTPKRTNSRPYMENDHPGRSNVPHHQQLKPSSWKPQRYNSPRWPRFQGNKYRSPGFRRDFNYNPRNNRPNFPRQGPSYSNNNWGEDFGTRQQHPDNRNWGGGYSSSRSMDHDDSMDMEAAPADGRPYESFQVSGNSSGGTMPLEKPWGYGQDDYQGGDPPYQGEDPVSSWGVNR